MTIALTTITGAPVTGLTSPTYSVASDLAPDPSSSEHYVITAIGGTQSGVVKHLASLPFTMTFWRPKILRFAKYVTALGGISFPTSEFNTYKVMTRKGLQSAAAQPIGIMLISTEFKIPVGADLDNLSVRAAISAHIGGLSQQSAGIGDLVTDNLL
jgi:hypothetical protein